MSEYSKLRANEVHNILFERMEKLAKRYIEIVQERKEFGTTHGEPGLNYHMLNAPTEQLILEMMDEIDRDKQLLIALGQGKVHVIVHLFEGILHEVEVHRDEGRARENYEKRIIEAYGKLVDEQHGDDEILMVETELRP